MFVFIWCIASGILCAQNVSPIEYLMNCTGTSGEDEMDPYEMERLSHFLERPVKINTVSLSGLVSTGLMSRYQAVSLMDYRSRHGDVLSLTELSSVDGFSMESVQRIAPFISLYSPRLPGVRNEVTAQADNDLAVRCNMKQTDSDHPVEYGYGMKYRVRYGECLSAGLSLSRSAAADSSVPDAYSGFLAYEFMGTPAKVIIGDFNARFGQGLALWNGMTMSGLSSPEGLRRNAAGISSSWSFTGGAAFTGLAAQTSCRQFSFSFMTALPEIKQISSPEKTAVLPAVNVSWDGKSAHVGLTHYTEFSGLFSKERVRIPDMKTSADFSICVRGIDLYSEVALDWVNMALAGIAGATFPAGDALRMSSIVRYYPSDYESGRSGAPRIGSGCTNELGAAVSGRFSYGRYVNIAGRQGFGSSRRRHDGTFAIDACLHPSPKEDAYLSVQVTPVVVWDVLMSENMKLVLRIKERMRTWGRRFRTDIRADIQWWSSLFTLTMRLNLLQCVSVGSLAYLEGSFKKNLLSVHLRQGVFFIDNWDDRIYAYERDAPGNFNVPAFYGRGLWTSFAGSWKFARWGRLYLRGSITSYPFMKEKKSGKAELKFQCVFSF